MIDSNTGNKNEQRNCAESQARILSSDERGPQAKNPAHRGPKPGHQEPQGKNRVAGRELLRVAQQPGGQANREGLGSANQDRQL